MQDDYKRLASNRPSNNDPTIGLDASMRSPASSRVDLLSMAGTARPADQEAHRRPAACRELAGLAFVTLLTGVPSVKTAEEVLHSAVGIGRHRERRGVVARLALRVSLAQMRVLVTCLTPVVDGMEPHRGTRSRRKRPRLGEMTLRAFGRLMFPRQRELTPLV